MNRAALALLLCAACGDDAAAIDAPTTPSDIAIDAAIDAPPGTNLGTVGTVPGACASGSLPGTACQIVEVACPGVAAARAEIRLTAAVGTVKGTVVFGTGGGGTGYYESDPTAASMMMMLAQMGYRVVQRKWQAMPNGWITGPGGMRALACRGATLLTYIHSTVHFGSTQTGFCATGNSGGSTEIAYALTHYDRGAILDLAVLTGGPPMGRIDHGCLDATDPTWVTECRGLIPTGSSTCTPAPVCGYSSGERMLIDGATTPATHCASTDASFRSSFLDQSVMGASPKLSYPNTWVHFLYGADDCTVAVPLGLTYASAVTSPKNIAFVPGTPHATFSTVAGATAIRNAIVNDCVPR